MFCVPFSKEKNKGSGIYEQVSPISIPEKTLEQILKKKKNLSNYSDDKRVVKDNVRLK